jgi:PST family polysaccharide transporter
VSWSAVSQIAGQGFGFAISIVLARLLGPKVYGLIGMVTVFTGFAALFGGLGLGAAIIQRKELEPRHLDAAFWANAVVGTMMAVFMAGAAPLVAWFYKEPRLMALTAVVGLRFVLDALNVVQISVLSREMRFRALAGIELASSGLSGLLGLGMALYGAGVWSLVLQCLGGSALRLLLAWRLADWRPRWSFEFRACKELFGFSASVLGFDLVNYWARNLDQLLIGRFAGANALGIYSRAYTLMLLPLNQVSRVVGSVMFPALSCIQDDKPRVKRAYLKAIGLIAFLTFPTMVGLFAVADHFVLALLGAKWSETIPILKLFCWVGLIQSILASVGWIYTSQGRTGLYLTMGVIGSGACAIAFLVGIHWGIMGVAWAYSITTALFVYPFFAVPGRLIGLSLVEAMRSLGATFLCSLAMGSIVLGAGVLLPAETAHWRFLAVQIPLGIVSYFTLVAGFNLNAWVEVRRAFSDMLPARLEGFVLARRLWALRKSGNRAE